MIFPEAESLDERQSAEWVERYLHPRGLRCPGCDATTKCAREFRVHKRGSVDYRCRRCQSAYNLYTSTVFSGSNLEPRRVLLLLRGIRQGEPASALAEELSLSRQCVQRWRKRIRENAYALLSDAAWSNKAGTGRFKARGASGRKRAEARRPDYLRRPAASASIFTSDAGDERP